MSALQQAAARRVGALSAYDRERLLLWLAAAVPGPVAAGLDQLDAAPPPAAHCDVCLAPLARDGSHISAISGAHIPAEPQPVTP